MELELLTNESDYLEFVIKGERHTFPNLLKDKLLHDKSVVFVSYILKHPFDNDAVFSIRTSGKKPKKCLEDALKEIEGELDEFEKVFKKAVK